MTLRPHGPAYVTRAGLDEMPLDDLVVHFTTVKTRRDAAETVVTEAKAAYDRAVYDAAGIEAALLAAREAIIRHVDPTSAP